jgi:hypothetical protein
VSLPNSFGKPFESGTSTLVTPMEKCLLCNLEKCLLCNCFGICLVFLGLHYTLWLAEIIRMTQRLTKLSLWDEDFHLKSNSMYMSQ